MSTIWTSGAIESMTPRQIAGADSGPKSVRKEMTGRSIVRRWYRSGMNPKRRPEEVGAASEDFPAERGGPSAGRWVDSGSAGDERLHGLEAIVGAEPAGPAQLA